MTIEVGDALPSAVFTVMTAEGPKLRTTEEIFKNRRVVLFGVPGAFTPVCSSQHLTGFLANAAAFKAKGIDEIAVTSVNDAFVMGAWARDSGVTDQITFLADGNGTFAQALDLTIDLTERGLGIRSKRYSMLVEDGVVKKLNVEETTAKTEVSGAEALLQQI